MTDRYDPDEFARRANATDSDAIKASARASDMARLERGVRQLVEQLHNSQSEVEDLRRKLEANEGRVRDLEEEVLASNQRRQDAVKRIDDLVAWIDRLTESNAPTYSVSDEAQPTTG